MAGAAAPREFRRRDVKGCVRRSAVPLLVLAATAALVLYATGLAGLSRGGGAARVWSWGGADHTRWAAQREQYRNAAGALQFGAVPPEGFGPLTQGYTLPLRGVGTTGTCTVLEANDVSWRRVAGPGDAASGTPGARIRLRCSATTTVAVAASDAGAAAAAGTTGTRQRAGAGRPGAPWAIGHPAARLRGSTPSSPAPPVKSKGDLTIVVSVAALAQGMGANSGVGVGLGAGGTWPAAGVAASRGRARGRALLSRTLADGDQGTGTGAADSPAVGGAGPPPGPGVMAGTGEPVGATTAGGATNTGAPSTVNPAAVAAAAAGTAPSASDAPSAAPAQTPLPPPPDDLPDAVFPEALALVPPARTRSQYLSLLVEAEPPADLVALNVGEPVACQHKGSLVNLLGYDEGARDRARARARARADAQAPTATSVPTRVVPGPDGFTRVPRSGAPSAGSDVNEGVSTPLAEAADDPWREDRLRAGAVVPLVADFLQDMFARWEDGEGVFHARCTPEEGCPILSFHMPPTLNNHDPAPDCALQLHNGTVVWMRQLMHAREAVWHRAVAAAHSALARRQTILAASGRLPGDPSDRNAGAPDAVAAFDAGAAGESDATADGGIHDAHNRGGEEPGEDRGGGGGAGGGGAVGQDDEDCIADVALARAGDLESVMQRPALALPPTVAVFGSPSWPPFREASEELRLRQAELRAAVDWIWVYTVEEAPSTIDGGQPQAPQGRVAHQVAFADKAGIHATGSVDEWLATLSNTAQTLAWRGLLASPRPTAERAKAARTLKEPPVLMVADLMSNPCALAFESRPLRAVVVTDGLKVAHGGDDSDSSAAGKDAIGAVYAWAHEHVLRHGVGRGWAQLLRGWAPVLSLTAVSLVWCVVSTLQRHKRAAAQAMPSAAGGVGGDATGAAAGAAGGAVGSAVNASSSKSMGAAVGTGAAPTRTSDGSAGASGGRASSAKRKSKSGKAGKSGKTSKRSAAVAQSTHGEAAASADAEAGARRRSRHPAGHSAV